MACAVPAADLIAVCLELAEYDCTVAVAEVIRRFEAGQAAGAWPAAYREEVWLDTLLYWLGLRLGLYELDLAPWPPSPLEHIALGAWLQPMLAAQSAYCNDEGEWWEAAPGGPLPCNQRLAAFLATGCVAPTALRRMIAPLGLACLTRYPTCRLPADEAACSLVCCWRRP